MKDKTASDIMTRDVVAVGPNQSLLEAIDLITRNRVSGLPVVDGNGRQIGCITQLDILNFALSGNADSTKVEEAMCSTVISFSPTASVAELVNCFAKHRIRRLPIVENEKVVGVVSRGDVLNEMRSMYK